MKQMSRMMKNSGWFLMGANVAIAVSLYERDSFMSLLSCLIAVGIAMQLWLDTKREPL